VRKILLDKRHPYRTAAIIISLIIITVVVFFEPVYSFVFFPIYVATVFMFYYKSTGKFDWRFLLYLVLNMVAEMGFVYDFTTYYALAVITTFIGEILLILVLKPLWHFDLKKISTHNMGELIIGFLGVSSLVIYMLYIIMPQLQDVILFIPTIITFTWLCILFFGIPIVNKHPNNIYLWAMGSFFIGELFMALTYEYIQRDLIFLVLAYFCGLSLKLALTIYLTKIPFNKKIEDDYL